MGLQQPGFGLLGRELAKQAGQPLQTQRRQPQRTGKIELLVQGALMEHLQVRIVAGDQLHQNVALRLQGVFAADQRGADPLGDNHHLQQVGLLDQRHAQLVGKGDQRGGNGVDIGLAGEDHHPGDAALFALHQQLDQVGFIPGMVDAGDKHQLAAHDPLGDMFIFRHIVPAYGPLQPLLSRPQTQGGESLKGQQFADRQAHGSCSATAAGWRLLSRVRAI